MERPSPEEIEYQLEHYNDSYVNEIHVSMSICLALATVAVILRVLARRMNKASLGKDDHMIFVALVREFYSWIAVCHISTMARGLPTVL